MTTSGEVCDFNLYDMVLIWARTKTYCVMLKSEENQKNENYDSIHWKKKKFELCKKRSTQILPTKMKVKPLHGWHFPNPSISTTFNELYTSLKFCTSFSNTFNTRTFQRLNTWLCWGVLSQWMACAMIMLMIQTEWLVQWSCWWFKQRQNFPPSCMDRLKHCYWICVKSFLWHVI